MKFQFTTKVVLTLEHETGATTSKHVATDFNLTKISNNLDAGRYLKKGQPTKDGSHVITNCLVQGLVGNIHMAHQMGFKDSAEHLRYIISELERGFIEVAKVSESEFGKDVEAKT
jgi:hypothetical protein